MINAAPDTLFGYRIRILYRSPNVSDDSYMGRPTEVRVGIFTWSVRWGKREVKRLIAKGDEAGGACAADSLTIAVEPLPKARLMERSVLLHEVLHACFAQSAYPMTYDEEEKVVATLTNPLLSALRDNPELVAYLAEE